MHRALPISTLLLIVFVALFAFAPTTARSGAAESLTIAVDCDAGTAGIQSSCSTGTGGAYTAEVVLANDTGGAVQLGAFGFTVTVDETVLEPATSGCSGTSVDCNPDLAPSVTGTWSCNEPSPIPDSDPDPEIATSLLGCVNAGNAGPVVPDGAQIVLGSITYARSVGFTALTMANVSVFDDDLFEIGSCRPTVSVTATCADATLTIGIPPTDTSTATASATATPTPRGDVPPFEGPLALFIDCEPDTFGIQVDCEQPSGQETVDVDVVLVNDSPNDLRLAAFDFRVIAEGGVLQAVTAPACVDTRTDCNPDLPEDLEGQLFCYPTADSEPAVPIVYSVLGCIIQSGGPEVSRGGTLILGTIRYTSSGGTSLLSFDNGTVMRDNLDMFWCMGEIHCGPSTLEAGATEGGASTATPTPTNTPTVTPTTCSGVCPTATTIPNDAFSFSLDCDPEPGIQSACSYPPRSDVAVDVVFTNSTTLSFGLGAIGFTLLNTDKGVLAPIEVPCLAPAHDCNPDFNQSAIPGGLNCGAPPPRADTGWDGDPETSQSYIGCNTGLPQPNILRAGESVVVATVRFEWTSNGHVTMHLRNLSLYDETYLELMSCNPRIVLEWGDCFGATIEIGMDNCPDIDNVDQSNADGNYTDHAPHYLVDDVTHPNSDYYGDACDDDSDNDGLLNTTESSASALAAVCPSASGTTDPSNADTDGDAVSDYAECALGSDPTDDLSQPAAGMDSDADRLSDVFEIVLGTDPQLKDSDGDGLQDGWEFLGWGTDPLQRDSDGDTGEDGCEAASVNVDTVVNPGDQALLAREVLRSQSATPLSNLDMNKDGVVNPGDQAFQASRVDRCSHITPWV